MNRGKFGRSVPREDAGPRLRKPRFLQQRGDSCRNRLKERTTQQQGPSLTPGERRDIAESLAELVKAYSSWIGLAQRKIPKDLRRLLDPEDVLQECFLHVLSASGHSAAPVSRSAWFAAVLSHVAKDTVRHFARDKQGGLETRKAIPDVADPDAASPLENLLTRESSESIGTAIHELSEPSKSLFLLVCGHKVPLAQAARRVRIGVAAASCLLWRTKHRLRGKLKSFREKELEDREENPSSMFPEPCARP